MSVFNTITTSALAYERKFADTYIHLASVQDDEISGLFSPEPRFGGEATMLNYIGTLEARSQLTEFERLQFGFIQHSRRLMSPQFFYVATPLDRAVTWQMVADPSNDYMTRCREAMNRKRSSLAMTSIFADVVTETLDATTGARSTATSAFPSANQVAVNFSGKFLQTNVTLTFDKLLKVNSLMFNNKVSPNKDQKEEIIVPIDYDTWLGFLAQKIDLGASDLLPAIKTDYLTAKDVDFTPGSRFKIGPWTFLFTHGLLTDGSGYARVPVFLPSGLKKGTGPMDAKFLEPDMFVSTRAIKVWETVGLMRSEDYKVYEIKVNNA